MVVRADREHWMKAIHLRPDVILPDARGDAVGVAPSSTSSQGPAQPLRLDPDAGARQLLEITRELALMLHPHRRLTRRQRRRAHLQRQ